MTQPTLSEVRKRAESHVEALKERLVKAPLAQVIAIQERITAFRQIIAWFEGGAKAEALMNDEIPSETPDSIGGY